MFGYIVEYYSEHSFTGFYIIRGFRESDVKRLVEEGYEDFSNAVRHELQGYETADDFHGRWRAIENWTGVKGKWITR